MDLLDRRDPQVHLAVPLVLRVPQVRLVLLAPRVALLDLLDLLDLDKLDLLVLRDLLVWVLLVLLVLPDLLEPREKKVVLVLLVVIQVPPGLPEKLELLGKWDRRVLLV